MIPEGEKKPRRCPECGEELVGERCSFEGNPITVVACTGYPDCDYFYWKLSDGAEGPENDLDFGNTADWAIGKSLRVILNNRTRERYAPLRGLFEGSGGAGYD